jgi:hypothetical protein
MKKFKFGFVFVVLCMSVVLLSGCFSNKLYNLSVNKLAEVRYNLYYGGNTDIEVTLMSGKREKDYIINGYCTEPVEFGVLTFKVLDDDLELSGEQFYVLVVGTTRYDGNLEKNPFDGTYVADLKKIIESDLKMTAKIMIGTFVHEVELKNATKDWVVNHDEALKIACKELKPELETFIENGEFAGEVYVKIITEKEFTSDTYYWYVNFVNRTGKTLAIIIDPMTKEILAKKSA